MPRKSLEPREILSILATTPDRFAAGADGLEAERCRTTPSFGGWSLNEVLGHLRSCQDVWGDAIRAILDRDVPTIRAMDPRTWIQRTDYLGLDFRTSLAAFSARRDEQVEELASLSPAQWALGAVVIGAGKPLSRTVRTYAAWMARHERSHYRQIQRAADDVRG